MKELIIKEIEKSIKVKAAVLNNNLIIEQLNSLVNNCIKSLKSGGKIIFCGNGGSFADSQHLAAEFISRLRFDRAPLSSIALGTNSSNMSAIGNDYGFDQVFKREILALGNSNDIAPFFQVSPLHKYQPSYCVLVFPEPSLFCK